MSRQTVSYRRVPGKDYGNPIPDELPTGISKTTFGITPSQHKHLKDLKSQNLRDHMTDLELIFSMLGEASTKEIVVNTNPKVSVQNKKAAKAGGKIAGPSLTTVTPDLWHSLSRDTVDGN